MFPLFGSHPVCMIQKVYFYTLKQYSELKRNLENNFQYTRFEILVILKIQTGVFWGCCYNLIGG
jgi:hypothetical protein